MKGGNNMKRLKKLLALMLVLATLMGALPISAAAANVVDKGTWNHSKWSWTLNSSGKLVIKGKGAFNSAPQKKLGTFTLGNKTYPDMRPRWSSRYLPVEIRSVEFKNGVTQITGFDLPYGDGAVPWSLMPYVTSVTIPASVKKIDSYAIQGMPKLRVIYGYKGTAAEKFARSHGLTFKALKSVKTPALTSVKNTAKKTAGVKWKKVSGVTGYQISYQIGKGKAKTMLVKNPKAVSATLKKLSVGKTYTVKIRAYQTVKGKKTYSSWSKPIKVKIAK
jgi:hypothetical protein